jgi:hypothetical protein
MKYPHCGESTKLTDKTSPTALLRHLGRTKNNYENQLKNAEYWHKKNGRKIQDWLPACIEKWQKWYDWVEEKINQDVASKDSTSD